MSVYGKSRHWRKQPEYGEVCRRVELWLPGIALASRQCDGLIGLYQSQTGSATCLKEDVT